MNDRISNHPNRWVLTPVTGETNTYDFTRADDPTQTGTPLNTATFLPDAVASAVESATGASDIELPADAFDALASAIDSIGLTNNAKIAYGSYAGTGTSSTSSYLDITFPITPRMVVITRSDGAQISSSGVVLHWIYNQTATVVSTGTSIDWVLNGKTLRRKLSRSGTAALLANESGVTYYYVGVGE